MQKIKSIFLSIMVGMTLCLPSMTVCAEEGRVNTSTIPTVEPVNEVSSEDLNNFNSDEIKNMTGEEYINNFQNTTMSIDDVGDKVIGKLNDVVVFLQRAMYFISLIGFIIGGAMILTGAISKRATVMPGIMTCVAAIVAYIISMNAAPLVQSISTWFWS